MHALAKKGKITGLGFVAYIEGHDFIANSCGDAYMDPNNTTGMLYALARKLAVRIDGREPMKPLILAMLIAASLGAQAAMATLVRQYMGRSVTGQTIVVCVYQYNGQHFERYHPLGTFCPFTVDVQ